MDINELLGINPEDPVDALAEKLVEADEDFLDRLIAIRIAQGLSQEEVGRRLGVGQSAIARIESGDRDPHLSTLRRYALAINALVRHDADIFNPASEPEPHGPGETDTSVEKTLWTYFAGSPQPVAWSEAGSAAMVEGFERRNEAARSR